MLTQERLKELLKYDPETGLFIRKINTRNSINAGSVAGCLDTSGYIKIKVDSKLYLGHRLVFLYVNGENPKHQVDHINGIRNDNRLINLREATHSENEQNQKRAHKDNKYTGLIGSTFDKSRNKYKSQITVNNKSIHLGLFSTAIEAHEKYIEAKRKMHQFGTL
jgi:hypothetical protein